MKNDSVDLSVNIEVEYERMRGPLGLKQRITIMVEEIKASNFLLYKGHVLVFPLSTLLSQMEALKHNAGMKLLCSLPLNRRISCHTPPLSRCGHMGRENPDLEPST